MKIGVTGGAGYLGSLVVRKLIEENFDVKVLDVGYYGFNSIKNLNVEIHKGDIRNIKDLVDFFDDLDVIVHLASIVGEPSSKIAPIETKEINTYATKLMIEILKDYDIKNFIFASTCSVYGYNQDICYENTKPNPLSLYAQTKLEGEFLLKENADFPYLIFRFGTVYGYSPRMRFDLVVNLLIAKAYFDHKITVFGRGVQKRPFVHVADLADSIVYAIKNNISNEIINLASENLSIYDMAKRIHNIIPTSEFVLVDKLEDSRSYIVSNEKAKKYGFPLKRKIEDGVYELLRAFNEKIITDYKDVIYSNYLVTRYLKCVSKL